MRRRGPIGVCDRCGFTVKHNELRHEFVNRRQTNLLVCGACYDEDHPQLYGMQDLKIDDPRPIRDARPDNYNPGLWGWNPLGVSNEAISAAGTIRVVIE